MDEIDESWEIFESFLSSQKVEKVYKDFQSCNCDCSKVIASNNLPVCTMCGLVESYFIDESPEWTSGVTEGGVSTDPSRCGNQATDLGLYSSSWGVGTIINTSYKTSYSLRRMARINFHTSMNHKDRSLFHAYKDIDEAAKQVLNISDAIVRDAKLMYRKFTGEKLTRGAVRLGIKANCVLYACKLANIPRTTKEVADAFDIPTKDVSRTTHLFRETILSDVQKTTSNITRPIDVINRLLNSFSVTTDRSVRVKCTKLCKLLEDCVPLMGKTPSSIASVVILIIMGEKTTKIEICEKCKISLPTLNKIELLAKSYLEGTVV